MATTIQQIELPKKARAVDTSGNNNHGQIYSGRGLEFDGVTDYLSVADSTTIKPTENVTIACWVKLDDTPGWSTLWGLKTTFGGGIWLAASSLGELRCELDGVVTHANFASGTNIMQENTWYRVVMTYDSSSGGVLYQNGVAVATTSETGSITQPPGAMHIGNTDQNYIFEGKMSDFQLWDKTFTQADVTYDYLNPESLALNGSGTALTESNLKLWYPMQDGHRGQQSYILDGANTGLGDEMISNGDFSDGTTGWTKATTASATQEIVDGKLRMYSGTAGDNSNQCSSTNVITAGKDGVMYRFTVDMSDPVSMANASIRLDGIYDASNVISFGEGSNTVHFKAYRDFTSIKFIAASHSDYYTIDNVSLKPINDKHHATTVFHGDELVTNGTFASGTTGWNKNTNTTLSVTNEQLDIQSGAGGGVYGYAYSTVNFVQGRTYKIDLDVISTNVASHIRAGSTSSLTGVPSNIWGSGDIGVGSQSITFVPTSNQAYFAIGGRNDMTTLVIDNVSVKEIGVASGWTDADQQLHIPQTALQSYNELAWFDGEADYVTIADHDDLSFDAFSVSAWINMNDATHFPVISKGAYNSTAEWLFITEGTDKLNLYLADESVSSCLIGRATAALTSSEGEWLHVVGTYDGGTASSGVKLYINGVQSDDSNAEGNPGSFVAMENLGAAVHVGKYNAHYANGAITETSLWNKELSSTEVLELFNDGKALDALTHSASSNIKGYWRNNGLSTWTDLKGSNNGTPTNITETILIPQGVDSTRDAQGFIMNKQKDTSCLNLTTPKAGGAEDENVSGVNISNSPTVDITSDLTICGWVKLKDKNESYNIIQKKTGWNAAGYGIYYHDTGDKWYVEYTDAAGNTSQKSNGYLTIPLDEWYFICFTHDDSGNDVQYQASSSATTLTAITHTNARANIATNTHPILIGVGNGGSVANGNIIFSGQLDGFLIYNKTLDETEVLRNFKATKGNHRN